MDVIKMSVNYQNNWIDNCKNMKKLINLEKKKKKTYCWCCHKNEFDIAVKWNRDLETRRKYFSLIKNYRFWVIFKLQDYFIQHCCVNQILLSASMEERDSKIQAIFQGEKKRIRIPVFQNSSQKSFDRKCVYGSILG